MIKPTVVLAGYGSWAKTAVNPAAETVAALREENSAEKDSGPLSAQCDLHCLEIPVDSNALYDTLEKALLRYRPDIWVGVGVAVESPAIRLETIGINVRYFDVPDNRGVQTEPTPVVVKGPVAYRANLPNDKIVQCLQAAGIPSVVSFHAGTHLCNQMLYSVLDLASRHSLELISGFVHVPQSTGNAALSSGSGGVVSSMSIPMMTQAVQIAVECALRSTHS